MKKFKSILVSALCFLFGFSLFAIGGCSEKEVEEENTDKEQGSSITPNMPYFESYTTVPRAKLNTADDMVAVTTYEQLEEIGWGGLYSQSFFETKSLIIIHMYVGIEERNESFSFLAVREGVIYPVFSIVSSRYNAAEAFSTIQVSIVVDKNVTDDYEFGKILVINYWDIGWKSEWYESFYDYFDSPNYECIYFTPGYIAGFSPMPSEFDN